MDANRNSSIEKMEQILSEEQKKGLLLNGVKLFTAKGRFTKTEKAQSFCDMEEAYRAGNVVRLSRTTSRSGR